MKKLTKDRQDCMCCESTGKQCNECVRRLGSICTHKAKTHACHCCKGFRSVDVAKPLATLTGRSVMVRAVVMFGPNPANKDDWIGCHLMSFDGTTSLSKNGQPFYVKREHVVGEAE